MSLIPDLKLFPTGSRMQVWYQPSDSTETIELDIRTITFNEEGQIIPLYDWFKYVARDLTYGTRLITGALQFNFSDEFHQTFRMDKQIIRNGTLIIEMYQPGISTYEAARKETVLIKHVYEHTFQHSPGPEPQSSVFETVPFSARDLVLQSSLIDLRTNREWQQDIDTSVSNRDMTQMLEYYGTVTRVADGDTLTVRLADGQEIRVRLAGADTPETRKPPGSRFKKNTDSEASWRFLNTAPVHPGESPPGHGTIRGSIYNINGNKIKVRLPAYQVDGRSIQPEGDGIEYTLPINPPTLALGDLIIFNVISNTTQISTVEKVATLPKPNNLDEWGEQAKALTYQLLNQNVVLIANPASSDQETPRGTAPQLNLNDVEQDGSSDEPRYVFNVLYKGEDWSSKLIREGLGIPIEFNARIIRENDQYVDVAARRRILYEESRAKAGYPNSAGVWSTEW